MTPRKSSPARATRSYTKRTTDRLVLFFAGVICYSLMPWVSEEITLAIFPVCVMAILTMLGVYQTVGHLDYRVSRGRSHAGDYMEDR